MDRYLVRRRWKLVRYADDFIICCRSREQAERAYEIVDKALGNLKLAFEPTKTRITSFDEGFDYLGVHFEGIVYSFLWKNKRMSVIGTAPNWLWSRVPTGYG
jgi:retron-type reverse transcriptase